MKKEIGDLGEEIALHYLLNAGYKILEKKWHYGHLELDIIAKEGHDLVVVEVKTRSGKPFEFPSDALTSKQMKMIVEAADAFTQQRDLCIETRFDLIIVILYGENHELEHFKEAFSPYDVT